MSKDDIIIPYGIPMEELGWADYRYHNLQTPQYPGNKAYMRSWYSAADIGRADQRFQDSWIDSGGKVRYRP